MTAATTQAYGDKYISQILSTKDSYNSNRHTLRQSFRLPQIIYLGRFNSPLTGLRTKLSRQSDWKLIMSLGPDGMVLSNQERRSDRMRQTIIQAGHLTFAFPVSRQDLSPAAQWLARDRQSQSSQEQIVETIIRAGCAPFLDLLQNDSFFNDRAEVAALRPLHRTDGSGYLIDPTSLAGELVALNYVGLVGLATRASSLVIAATMFEQGLGLDVPLHPFLQTIDVAGVAVDWSSAIALAGVEFRSSLGVYTVKPNPACDGLDFTSSNTYRTAGTWSPAADLIAYRDGLQRDTRLWSYTSESGARDKQKLAESLDIRPASVNRFVGMVLPPTALLALAYGGYYKLATDQSRVEGIPLDFAGNQWEWEKLVNTLLKSNDRPTEKELLSAQK